MGAPPRAAARAPVVCFPFDGGMIGGSHLSTLPLIERMGAHGYDPLVVVHEPGGDVAAMLAARGIAAIAAPCALPNLDRVGRLPQAAGRILALTRLLREHDVAILHTNEGAVHAGWTGAARLAGVPHVWHHRGNPRARGVRWLAPFLASRIVTVSDYATPQQRGAVRQRTRRIYSPFETRPDLPDRALARQRLRARLGLADDTAVALFVGQFGERKRPLVFLEAIARTRRHAVRPVHGIMLGEEFEPGQAARIAERIAELEIDDCVTLAGFQHPIEPWLAGADMLVVTAVEEPFGRTLIEAMAAGVPIIAANDGGNIEAIRHGETGLLVPRDAPEAFAEAIAELVASSTLAARLAAQAKRHAQATFGTERHVAEIVDLYREILA